MRGDERIIMKKILSLILALNLVFGVIPSSMAAFSDVDNSEAIEIVSGLGIMEGYTDGTFLPENNLTRAEFAKIISNIYTYGEEDDAVADWKENFFEGIFDETEFIPPEVMEEEEEGIFADVYTNHDYYDAINLVAKKRIMVGTGDNFFEPDGNLTVEQALKVITTMMGYGYAAQMQGGYPTGYTNVAESLELTDNVGNYAAYATRADIANIIYNALDIELMQLKFAGSKTYYETVEDETFLTMLINADYEEGRMTDNGITSLSDPDNSSADYVVINNKRYAITEETEYVRDYIGREVKVYYSLDSDAEEEFLFVTPTNEDKVVTFDIADFVKYEEGRITYYTEDGELEDIKVVKAPFMIKNGSAKPSFTDDDFEFNHGTVTVITKEKETNADVIILKVMQNFNVALVDTQEQEIYSNSSVIGNVINLDYKENDTFVRIYNSSGELKDIQVIANGSVTTVCMGEKLIEVYISDTVVSGFSVKSVSKNDNGSYVINDGKTSYAVSKDYFDATGFVPRIATTYDLKLDVLGNVVEAKQVAADYQVGFLNKVKIVEDEASLEEVLMMKYFDMTVKKIETVYPAEKIKITDTLGNTKTYRMQKNIYVVEQMLSDYITEVINNVETVTGALFRYKLNEDGEIAEIELAGTQENSSDNSPRFVEIKLDKSITNYNMYGATGYLGGQMLVPANVKILKCNYLSENFNSDSGYVVTDRNGAGFKENGKYDVKAYSLTKNSPVAEYIVYTADPKVAITTDTPHTVGIVLDCYEALNADEEACAYIKLDTTEYEVETEALAEGNVTNVQGASYYTDGNGDQHYFDVEKGDVIRYALNTDGRISQVQLLYDADADYSDGVLLNGQVYEGWSEKGNFAGCIAGFESTQYSYSNPFSVLSSGDTNTFATDPYTWTYYNSNMRVMIGTIVRTGSDYIITTTRNLSENPGSVESDGVYTQNLWSRSTVKVVTIKDNDDVVISTQPVSALKTYEMSGRSCDRIIITSRLGAVYNSIVYRYED